MRFPATWLLGVGAASALHLTACTKNSPAPADPIPTPTPDAEVVVLSPLDQLVRASMALRGIRPSVQELDAVAADPTALRDIVDGYTRTPAFDATMRDLHAETFLVRTDRTLLPPVFELAGLEGVRINASLTEEPLRLVEYIIREGRPYTEIVTADYTLADGVVAGVWGLPYDGDGEEWKVTRWDDGVAGSLTDDRPMAGILSSTGLFLRHVSNGSNYHRGRANMVTTALLCHDFLASDVPIDGSVDLSDPDAVADAVVSNPACASCHDSLDPIASFFWGYQNQLNVGKIRTDAAAGMDVYPLPYYSTNREDLWEARTGRAPALFGVPGTRLDDLGASLVADPRFAQCAVKRFYSYMAQVERDAIHGDVVDYLQQQFVASGYDARVLAREIALSASFHESHALTAERAETVAGFKKTRPEQMARLMADLTGFAWRTDTSINVAGAPYGRVDIANSDLIGLRTLAGGIDSSVVTVPSHTWNATASLFLQTYAAQAAGTVVEADFALSDPASRKLLGAVSATETGETAVRAQLALLHARLYGERVAADSPEVDESFALFASAAARSGGDAKHAWKTTLTAMLQDLRIASF